MPRFEPFPAIHYAPSRVRLADVAAPPYDVLTEAERDALAARDPHNIVLIDVPVERDGPDRYREAAERLQCWLGEGVLIVDHAAAFYLERMAFTDEAGTPRVTVGVLGALEVVDPGAGDVLPHEQTTPKARTDRLELTRATQANLSAVWGLSLATGLAALLDEPGKPIGELVDDEGVQHVFERIADPERIGAIQAAVTSAPVVIADGHHRYEVARTYRAEQRAARGHQGGPWDLTLALVVELAEERFAVQAIHRLVTDLPEGVDLESVLTPSFEIGGPELVSPRITRRLIDAGALCLVGPDGMGRLLRPRPEAFAGVADLDSARLDHALAGVEATIAYQHGIDNVLAAVRQGRAAFGVLLRPVTVEQIAATANENALMPPKTTFFTPKLKTGLALRSLAAAG